MRKNKIIWFNDLSLQHFGRSGMWKLFLIAIRCRISGTYSLNKGDKEAFTVGTAEPDERLWEAGWRVGFAGYILGLPVLLYEAPSHVSQ